MASHPIIIHCDFQCDIYRRADLLKDIDEAACAESLMRALDELDPSCSIRDVVNVALQTDDSLKKLRVLQVNRMNIIPFLILTVVNA